MREKRRACDPLGLSQQLLIRRDGDQGLPGRARYFESTGQPDAGRTKPDMLLSDEYRTVRLCVALCRGECKWSTISLKKAGLVHDLIEKI